MTSPLFIETDGASRLNLYDGVFKVVEGWVPEAAGDDPEKPIWETIPLLAEGTSAELTAALLDIRDKLRKARAYQTDLLVNQPVYLGMEFDTTEAHSTILKGSLKPFWRIGTSPYLNTTQSQVKMYVLRILRVPYWEEQTATEKSVVDISAWGGTADFANAEGTRDARIEQSYAYGLAIGKVWMGWRKERAGLTYFEPRVEIEDGSITDTLDTALYQDANASPSDIPDNCWEIDFVNDATLIKRGQITIGQQVGATGGTNFEHHYKGRYLVIAKWKGGDSTTKFGVQLRHGYTSSYSAAANQEVLFQNDNWKSVPMGVVTLPPQATQHDSGLIDDDLTHFKFEFWAEQISGTANLYLDGFVLMPTDHLVTVTRNPDISGGIERYWFYTRADGRPAIIGKTLTGGSPDQLSEASFQNFRIPLDDSKLVYVREFGATDANSKQTMIATDDLYFYWKAAWDDYYVSRA